MFSIVPDVQIQDQVCFYSQSKMENRYVLYVYYYDRHEYQYTAKKKPVINTSLKMKQLL